MLLFVFQVMGSAKESIGMQRLSQDHTETQKSAQFLLSAAPVGRDEASTVASPLHLR